MVRPKMSRPTWPGAGMNALGVNMGPVWAAAFDESSREGGHGYESAEKRAKGCSSEAVLSLLG